MIKNLIDNGNIQKLIICLGILIIVALILCFLYKKKPINEGFIITVSTVDKYLSEIEEFKKNLRNNYGNVNSVVVNNCY